VLARATREDGASADASIERLVKSMRSGEHDGNDALYSALIETADVAAAIWNPANSS
jgi:hypothetical protein